MENDAAAEIKEKEERESRENNDEEQKETRDQAEKKRTEEQEPSSREKERERDQSQDEDEDVDEMEGGGEANREARVGSEDEDRERGSEHENDNRESGGDDMENRNEEDNGDGRSGSQEGIIDALGNLDPQDETAAPKSWPNQKGNHSAEELRRQIDNRIKEKNANIQATQSPQGQQTANSQSNSANKGGGSHTAAPVVKWAKPVGVYRFPDSIQLETGQFVKVCEVEMRKTKGIKNVAAFYGPMWEGFGGNYSFRLYLHLIWTGIQPLGTVLTSNQICEKDGKDVILVGFIHQLHYSDQTPVYFGDRIRVLIYDPNEKKLLACELGDMKYGRWNDSLSIANIDIQTLLTEFMQKYKVIKQDLKKKPKQEKETIETGAPEKSGQQQIALHEKEHKVKTAALKGRETRVKNRETAVNTREKRVAEQEQEVMDKEQALREKEKALLTKQNELEKKDHDLEERERELKKRKKKLEKSEQAVILEDMRGVVEEMVKQQLSSESERAHKQRKQKYSPSSSGSSNSGSSSSPQRDQSHGRSAKHSREKTSNSRRSRSKERSSKEKSSRHGRRSRSSKDDRRSRSKDSSSKRRKSRSKDSSSKRRKSRSKEGSTKHRESHNETSTSKYSRRSHSHDSRRSRKRGDHIDPEEYQWLERFRRFKKHWREHEDSDKETDSKLLTYQRKGSR